MSKLSGELVEVVPSRSTDQDVEQPIGDAAQGAFVLVAGRGCVVHAASLIVVDVMATSADRVAKPALHARRMRMRPFACRSFSDGAAPQVRKVPTSRSSMDRGSCVAVTMRPAPGNDWTIATSDGEGSGRRTARPFAGGGEPPQRRRALRPMARPGRPHLID
ncbi:MAG: hypothetical protein U0610_04695 [bacterium]